MPQLVDQFGHPLGGKVITANYKPVDMRYFTAVRDLPPLSLPTIEVMRKDSMVKLCLGILAAPLHKMELAYKEGDAYKPGVLAESPVVAEWVQRQFTTIWKWVSHLCKAQVYGWAAAEVTWKYGDGDMLEVDEVLPRHARDTKAMVQSGKVIGVQFDRVKSANSGHEPIGFPLCLWHVHDPEPGMFYGKSILEGAYSPWWDKWMRGGALDVRRLFMFKDAYGGMDLSFPYKIYYDENQRATHAKDIAREVVEQSQAGAVTTRPFDADPVTGKNMWEMTRATVPSNPQHIREYPKDLDGEIRHGMGVGDDVITTESTGSWNGKGLAMFGLMVTRDEWGALMLRDAVEQVIRPGAVLNFGPDVFFEATHKPFAEQLKDQLGDSPQQQGGGGFQNRNGGMMGGQQQQDAIDGEFSRDDQAADLEPDGMLRLSLARVGRGALEAQRLVQLGQQVVRMANVGPMASPAEAS